ncbi:MAG: hypothetical protein K2X44_09470 [Magnetospirillum sp.]|nr:hypothetical protein [Magnetospirillum sp.]
MCDFQYGTIECEAGRLWDADGDYHPDFTICPCPKCNTENYLLHHKEGAETTSYFQDMLDTGTGADIWSSAVKAARYWNAAAATAALAKIGRVEAIIDDDTQPDGYRVQAFTY